VPNIYMAITFLRDFEG